MLDLVIAQSESLSADWVKYIVGGLVVAIVAMGYFIRWIFTFIVSAVSKGIEKGWNDAKEGATIAFSEAKGMHKEAMQRFDKSLEIGMENKVEIESIKGDVKEIKYSQQTMSREAKDFKCKQGDDGR